MFESGNGPVDWFQNWEYWIVPSDINIVKPFILNLYKLM